MSHLRFNHVFFGLMSLAALSAAFSPRVSEKAQAQLQTLFIPVARPMYAFGGWSHERLSPPKFRDDGSPHQPRDVRELVRENADLRTQILTVTAELERLKELTADRSKLGDLTSRCTPVTVGGGDAGERESLFLLSGTTSGLRDDLPVLCPDGVVGKLTRVGLTSSRVRLITDKGNKVRVSFVRFEKGKDGATHMSNVSYPDCIAIGQGVGTMLITHRPWNELKGTVVPNDWAILNDDDPEWSRLTYRVGRVNAVEQQKDAAGFGQIKIESVVDLTMLREVMVLTK